MRELSCEFVLCLGEKKVQFEATRVQHFFYELQYIDLRTLEYTCVMSRQDRYKNGNDRISDDKKRCSVDLQGKQER